MLKSRGITLQTKVCIVKAVVFPVVLYSYESWTTKRTAATAAKSHQSCPTLCNPIDGSPPGSRPWDSPGTNTGVGCHFFLQCMKVKSESEVTQLCPDSSGPHGLQPTRLLRPWDFPGKSTGVGCHCLLRKRTECQRIDAFELWYWRRLLRVPWIARRSNQSILKEINSEY